MPNELHAKYRLWMLYKCLHRHKTYCTCTCYVIPSSLCPYREMYISQTSPPSQPVPLFVLNALDISHVRFFVWHMLTTCRQLRDPRASTSAPGLSTLCNWLESSCNNTNSPHWGPRVTKVHSCLQSWLKFRQDQFKKKIDNTVYGFVSRIIFLALNNEYNVARQLEGTIHVANAHLRHFLLNKMFSSVTTQTINKIRSKESLKDA